MQIEPKSYLISFLDFFAFGFLAARTIGRPGREKKEEKKKEMIELNSIENAARFIAGTWSGLRKTDKGTFLYKYVIHPDGTFDRFFVPYGEPSWGEPKSSGTWYIESERNMKTGEVYYLAAMKWKEADGNEVTINAILDNKFGESLFIIDMFGKYTFIVNRHDILEPK